MEDWREKHFNVPPETKKLRELSEPESSGGFGWLLLLLVLLACGVAVAFSLGAFEKGPPVRAVIVEERGPEAAPAKRPPNANITFSAKLHEDAPPSLPTKEKTITQARANELRRIITSRESGIDLMQRDRLVSMGKYNRAQSDLETSKLRLTDLERKPPPQNNSGAVYQWNIAHADAIAAAKNATNLMAGQQKVIEGFNGRIRKAENERDAAKEELSTSVIISD